MRKARWYGIDVMEVVDHMNADDHFYWLWDVHVIATRRPVVRYQPPRPDQVIDLVMRDY
jgi:hypothetical protein